MNSLGWVSLFWIMLPTPLRRPLAFLSFKIGSTFAVGVLLAVVGMGVYAYSWARLTELEHGLNELATHAREGATRIDLYLASGRGLAEHLAATRDAQGFLEGLSRGRVPRGLQEGMEAWLDLQQQAVRTRGLSAIFVMSPEGRCIASSTRAFEGRDFSFRPYFQEAMAGHLATSDWVIGSVVHTPRVFSAAPVRSRGRIVGVLVTEFLVEEVEKAVGSFAFQGRTAAVINAEGIIIAHSEPELQYHAVMPLTPAVQAELVRTRQFLGRAFPVEALPEAYRAAFQRARDGGASQTLKYQAGATSRWGAFTTLTERPWVVVVSIPENEILLPIRRALRSTCLVAVGITLAVFLLGLALGRALLRPLHRLSEAMRRFGAGDASARAPLGKGELGQLGATFNGMADTLQVNQEHLEDLVAARTLDLENTLAEVRTLRGMIPICSYCKKIRDDEGGWWQLERYIHDHAEVEFSHGICPECTKREFPGVSGSV